MDRIINASFYYWRTVLAVLFILFVGGIYSFISIPTETFPEVTRPVINIVDVLNGVSPSDAEDLLVRPIEEQVRTIKNIDEIISNSFQGGAYVQVIFETNTNTDTALSQVQQQVNMAQAKFPSGAQTPVISESSTSDIPIITIILHGSVPYRTLVNTGYQLRQALENLTNVMKVNMSGNLVERVNLIFDPAVMSAYHINPLILAQTLQQSNQFIPAGTQQNKTGAFVLDVPALFERVNDIMNIPIMSQDQKLVLVKDIATVNDTYDDQVTYATYNNAPAVTLSITKRSGANILEAIQNVKNTVKKLSKNWPTNLHVDYSQDGSKQVKEQLSDLENSLLLSMIIVMIVVLITLGIKNGLLIGISIPGSFVAAMFYFYATNATLNQVILFSFILAGGMLVDATIVVIEYAEKLLEQGANRIEAYRGAATRMAIPVISSTLTTVSAFVPMLFWPGLVGQFIYFLPLTVVVLLVASAFMSLIFIPILGAYASSVVRFLIISVFLIVGYMFGSLIISNVLAIHTAIIKYTVGALVGILFAFVAAFLSRKLSLSPAVEDEALQSIKLGKQHVSLSKHHTPSTRGLRKKTHHGELEVSFLPEDISQIKGFTGLYVRLLTVILHFPRTFVILIVLLMFGGWGWYLSEGKGVEFFPKIDPSFLQVIVRARGNLSATQKKTITDRVAKVVYAMNAQTHDFKSFYTSSGDFPAFGSSLPSDTVGFIVGSLNDWQDIRKPSVIQADLQERVKQFSGIHVQVILPTFSPQSQSTAVYIRVLSNDRKKINQTIHIIRNILENKPGVIDLNDSRGIPGIEWNLTINREALSKAGVSIVEVGGALQMATLGLELTSYRPQASYMEDKTKIYARFPQEYRNLTGLRNMRIITAQGNVPITNLLSIQPTNRTNVLYRYNSSPMGFVTANVQSGYNTSKITQALSEELKKLNLPNGVQVSFAGVSKDIQSSIRFLILAFIAAVLLMAAILLIQFNNFFQMIVILSAVVLSTTGVSIYLAVLGESFQVVMQGIAAISLAGVVVNNNIVLVDTYNAMRKIKPDDIMNVIISTCGQRLRPVLLTAGTTIISLLPLAFRLGINFIDRTVAYNPPSVQAWVALASTITTGMIFATVLTLFVTPAILLWRASIMQRLYGDDSRTHIKNTRKVGRKMYSR